MINNLGSDGSQEQEHGYGIALNLKSP